MSIQNTNLTYDLLGLQYSDPSPDWLTSEKYYNCDKFQNPVTKRRKKFKLFHK